MADRLTQIGEMAHGTVRQEDVCWMMDEIERLRNLKLALMELGNRLVIEHGWEPEPGVHALMSTAMNSTGVIKALTIQINSRPDMREALAALGYDWPTVEEDER